MNADLNLLSVANIRAISQDPRFSFAVLPFAVLPFISLSDNLSSSLEPVGPGVRFPFTILLTNPALSLVRGLTEN